MTGKERERTKQYALRLDRARVTLADEVEPDAAPVRDLSLDQRGDLVARLCASAWEILRSRDDFPATLDQREPPVVHYPAKWRVMHDRLRRAT
jgi:hypothetical protein